MRRMSNKYQMFYRKDSYIGNTPYDDYTGRTEGRVIGEPEYAKDTYSENKRALRARGISQWGWYFDMRDE